MNKYYFLVAGLPEIDTEDIKLAYSLSELKKLFEEQLKAQDYKYIELFFARFDNANLLKYLKTPEAKLDSNGNIPFDSFASIVSYYKGFDVPKPEGMPAWFDTFIPAYLEESPLYPNMSWEDQLAALYYEYAMKRSNSFIRDWFEFNLDVTNILTAFNCRNFGLSVTDSVVGSNEVAQTIRTNNTKEFGLTYVFDQLTAVMRLAEEPDLYERERGLDMLKWAWLEDNSIFKYFSIENIFAYLIQTEIVERWINLNYDKGTEVFRDIVRQLKTSFDFPEEYKLKK